MPFDRLPGLDLQRLPQAYPVHRPIIIKQNPWAALAAAVVPEIGKFLDPVTQLERKANMAKYNYEAQHYGAMTTGGYSHGYDPNSKNAAYQQWIGPDGKFHAETSQMYNGRMQRSSSTYDYGSIGQAPAVQVRPTANTIINPAPVQKKTLEDAATQQPIGTVGDFTGSSLTAQNNEVDIPTEVLYTNEDYPMDDYPSSRHYS